MKYDLPPLPYDPGSLRGLSARTVTIHHEDHQGGYVEKLNEIETVRRAPAETPIEALILHGAKQYHAALESPPKQSGKVISVPEILGVQNHMFNMASQVYNHSMYFRSMHPEGGGKPEGPIAQKIFSTFGTTAHFRKAWVDAAMGVFGSGWLWLCLKGQELVIVRSFNAGTPIVFGLVPIVVMDVWEHAYYLDYQADRAEYVGDFVDSMLNWNFANENVVAHLKS